MHHGLSQIESIDNGFELHTSLKLGWKNQQDCQFVTWIDYIALECRWDVTDVTGRVGLTCTAKNAPSNHIQNAAALQLPCGSCHDSCVHEPCSC